MSQSGDVLVVVVIPFRDERAALSTTLTHLANSIRSNHVDPTATAIVGIDNSSSDQSADVFSAAAWASGFTAVTVEHSGGAVVSARALGFAIALKSYPMARLFVSLDADTFPGPNWLSEALTLLEGGADAISFIGSFPATFWRSVPTLTARYTSEVGTIFFDQVTARQVLHRRDCFHQTLFDRIGRTLVDQLFAIRPDSYQRSGGHLVRTDERGFEVLHEGGRLAYQLSLIGARTVTARQSRYTTSPRRLIGEPRALFSGASYEGELRPNRVESESTANTLDASASDLNYGDLRRYVIRNYILFQLLCRPDMIQSLSPRLLPGRLAKLTSYIADARAGAADGFAAITAAAALDDELGAELDSDWRATASAVSGT